MALVKARSRGINLADTFAFTGTVSGDNAGNYVYLKLVDYFNRRYNDDSLTENINVDRLDSVVVLNNLPENECCICLEEYKENDVLIKLKCNHMFHKECLEPWFNNNKNSCPLCRYKLKV